MKEAKSVSDKSLPYMVCNQSLLKPNIFIQMEKDSSGIFSGVTYKDFVDQMLLFATGLRTLGVKKDSKIGLISDNCQRWLVSSMAIMATGAADIPRGKDVSVNDLGYILGFVDCEIAIVENDYVYRKLCEALDKIPTLRYIIIMSDDDVDKNFLTKGDSSRENASMENPRNIFIHKFSDIIKMGQKNNNKDLFVTVETISNIKPSDTATIIFTSGTTGVPKGAELTHENFLCQIDGITKLWPLKAGNKALCVLPVWHVYEREMEYCLISMGVTLCYSRPIPQMILADLQKEKIYFMAAVPRIWDALYKAIQKKLHCDKGPAWLAFKTYVGVAYAKLLMYNIIHKRTIRFKNNYVLDVLNKGLYVAIFFLLPICALGEFVVFKKARRVFGKHFKLGISGGGALPHKIDRFFNSIGLHLIEAYGLTETAPIVSMRNFRKNTLATIGKTLPYCQTKVLDKDGQKCKAGVKGVLFVKGPNVMKGYYKDEQLTREAINDDWFCTGDIALKTITGDIRIIGRQKDTIVLRSGENVEPLPIENKLLESPYISQAVIVGQDKNTLGALIIPQKDAIIKYATQYNTKINSQKSPQTTELLNIDNFQSLLKNDAIKDLIFKEFSRLVTAKNGFKAYEKIGKFTFLDKPFEVGVELSAKQDIVRYKINEIYKWQIKAMFSDSALAQNAAKSMATLDAVKNVMDNAKGKIIKKSE